jgi:hypothetical protein
MSGFEIKTKWISDVTATDAILAATLARIQIFLGAKNVTEYESGKKKEAALQIPTYYLAEWIAENWWVVLFEPRKDEDSDDSEFISRHSILAAQHGFALPALSIMPSGRSIHLNSSPRRTPYANAQFTRGASIDAPRQDVEAALSRFVDETVGRLLSHGIETHLAAVWGRMKALTPEEREFCELIGSLGWSPGEISDQLGNAVERIYEILGSRATRDFCLAATREVVEESIRPTQAVAEYLHQANEAKIGSLTEISLPSENFSRPPWMRGMLAAKNVRDRFNISISDVRGADKLFERLEIDTAYNAHLADINDLSALPFTGAVNREDATARVALLQSDELHRRFAAGRIAYLAWASERESRRLVTNAVTRDQQASRSFAAEILVPQTYLKRLAGNAGKLDYEQIRTVARERRAMPDVARKQAYNAGIRITSY